jgi:hypothetical protein
MTVASISRNELYAWVNKYFVVASKVYPHRVLGSQPRIAPATLACATTPLTMLVNKNGTEVVRGCGAWKGATNCVCLVVSSSWPPNTTLVLVLISSHFGHHYAMTLL